MKAIALYARIFLAGALPFGLFAAGVGGLRAGAVAGGIFGGVTSLGIGTLSLVGQRGLGGPRSPRQELAFRVPEPGGSVYERASAALRNLPARIEDGEYAVRITARTRSNWLTWGERVTVELCEETGSTDVVVRSRPAVPMVLADYGQGRRHVVRLAAAISADGTRTAG